MTGLGKRLRVSLYLLLALWIVLNGGVGARAESSAPTVHRVQAAFLFNFAKFVTWPDEAFQRDGDSLIIGVLGEDPFGSILEETIRDKTIAGKKLVVKRFVRVQDAANSHILFLSSSEESHVSQTIKALEKTNVLTVSDMEQFTDYGGMVAFTMEDQKVHFNVNVEAVERAGLKMGSQLLKLARIVGEKARKEN
jgi:uncharacterized protein DUF4154